MFGMFTRNTELATDDIVRSWKQKHPDWQTHTTTSRMARVPPTVQQRRQQLCQSAAELFTTGMHRMMVEKYGLSPNAGRGHLAAYVESFAKTHYLEHRGIHLPMHQEMEQQLARAIMAIDRHMGHLGTDTAMQVQHWFEMNVRQPIGRALQQVKGRR